MPKDMRGVEIEVDDLFAMPFSEGSHSVYMRVGRVVELVPAKGTSTGERIRVEWLYGGGWSMPEKPTLISVPERGMVLPDDFPTQKR